jgi:iron(III) transport system substrate-binding protein
MKEGARSQKPQASRFSFLLASGYWLLASLLLLGGCNKSTDKHVVLYTSIDEPIARPIVNDFEKQTGIKVTLVTDTEATKSIGLAEKLRAEKAHPQADVWWSNEPFLTINLADEGVLAPYESKSAADVPKQFVDPDHRWAAVGMRLRVIVNSSAQAKTWKNLEDLTDPALKGKIGIARPTAGTTGGHVAALYELWGETKADEFFRALRANDVKLLGGNSVVAEEVGKGTLWAGITDNDDAAATIREGGKLVKQLPDQETFGTLAIPTTVGFVTGASNETEAKQLIDFLLSKEVEQKLIADDFAAGSVRSDASQAVKTMTLDYRAVAKRMPDAIRRATAIMEGRE